jgi:F-type H+-transporting ATPase subunit b
VISGIELGTDGQKLAWSIADYLVSLENDVDELLNGKDKPEAKGEAQSKSKPKPESKPEEPEPGTKS